MAAASSAPRIIDNDQGEITITLDGEIIRSWSYATDTERSTKIRAAHEFCEGWHAANAGETDMSAKIKVDIASSRPLFIEADANAFGQVFAAMACDDKVKVFRAMCEAMKPHPIQWDYISIELEKPENSDVLDTLREVLLPS